ncbi:phosphate ABC transporter permease PstA [Pendulispora albinea]|uniref:Phosphate transport system permease protein PstA n=1 Tax=Pendulispora albinea TaxID=2741071 RepID=A0ABZ2M184_9BACT
MSSLAEMQKTRRRHKAIETVLERGLAAGAVGLAGLYALGLLVLTLRGGHKVTGFTVYPSPLLDIRGEDAIRFIFAASIFACGAWGLSALVQRVAGTKLVLSKAKVRAAIVVIAVLGALLFRDHLPRFLIALPSDTTAGGGVGPEIFNTLYAAAMSTAITLPIGIGAAVYLARFAGGGRFVAVVRMALDTLASLPSIVYGLFGFLVFVVEMRAGYSLLAGAFVLALLNLPLVVGVAEESIRSVPRELEDASLALGATRVQTTLRVTIPYAWPGILSALVLSIGRVFAESAPLVMTAGTTISRADAYSLDPMRGGETLAVHLWYVNSAGLSPDRADVSAGTAAVLIVLIGLTNFLASRLAHFGGRR